jgi:hypothetical protein
MKTKYISNRAGVAILDIKGRRVPVTPKPRTIGQNLAISQSYVQKAVSHDTVRGGVRG